jgi:hypothetical protein
LNERLRVLESNQQQLMETLSKFTQQTSHPIFLLTVRGVDMQHNNAMAMMVSLQRRLDHLPDDDREGQFCSHALRYLTTASGRQLEMEDWMITSYEVEFGRQIGTGGLYVLYCGLVSFCELSLKSQQRAGVLRDLE